MFFTTLPISQSSQCLTMEAKAPSTAAPRAMTCSGSFVVRRVVRSRSWAYWDCKSNSCCKSNFPVLFRWVTSSVTGAMLAQCCYGFTPAQSCEAGLSRHRAAWWPRCGVKYQRWKKLCAMVACEKLATQTSTSRCGQSQSHITAASSHTRILAVKLPLQLHP